jgi:hypothetical protein
MKLNIGTEDETPPFMGCPTGQHSLLYPQHRVPWFMRTKQTCDGSEHLMDYQRPVDIAEREFYPQGGISLDGK